MSNIAELKQALGRLSPAEYYEIADWLAEHAPVTAPEDIARIQIKLDEAERGSFRKVNPEEQIRKLVASLE